MLHTLRIRGRFCPSLTRCLATITGEVRPRVAVVGAGPAGFYATQHIAKALPEACIDIYDKLPVPYGLVRFGVAPDHPEVKNCITTFAKTATNPNVHFIGNTCLGRDVSLAQLRSSYHVVLLTYGTEEDRLLGVPGEQLDNILPARDLVSLYNGVPGYQDLEVNLDTDTVTIVGMGNVALDVARMILSPLDQLRKTDVTESWTEQLAKSRVKRVVLVGRRGPLQVSFTIKELREMVKLEGIRPVFSADQFEGVREQLSQLQRPQKRLAELLVKTALDPLDVKTTARWAEADREWEVRLFRSPTCFLPGSDGVKVGSVVLGVNQLMGEGGRVEPSGQQEVLDTGLVLRSIGYKSVQADPDLVFDNGRGVVPNTEGRVDGCPGLYVAGWLGTGPRGVIIDTMNTAFRVGAVVVSDLRGKDLQPVRGREGLASELSNSTSWEDWLLLDEEEKRRGEESGKPRQKSPTVQDMLHIIRGKY